jgi:hypothetical protein
MKTVMVLAVNFPPTGGVGVIRTLKFVKYLPAFGWHPMVVTLPAGTKQIQDNSLLNEVPEDIPVHRPPYFDYRRYFPKPVVKLIQSYEKRVYFPDKYIRWNSAALKYIENEIIDKQKIDLVYTSVGPHSTLLLAHEIKKRFNIPIFIDFRDPFSFSQYALLDTKHSYQEKAQAIETKVFKDADQINNVSRIWQQAYESRYPEIGSKSSLIHNGYDEKDFAHLGQKKRNDVFTVGYNGTFSRIVPLDPLMEAIREIYKEHQIAIRLSIATPIKKTKLTSRYPYHFQNNLVDHKGFLPHKMSLANLHQSDVSALILNDIEATQGMIPAKTFEYLRIHNPILLLHRKGSFLAKIIEKTKTGLTANITDQKDIMGTLLKLHEKWRHHQLDHKPDWKEIQKYERKHLTYQLADTFNRLVTKKGIEVNNSSV